VKNKQSIGKLRVAKESSGGVSSFLSLQNVVVADGVVFQAIIVSRQVGESFNSLFSFR